MARTCSTLSRGGHGTACLNGEPSSFETVRFGEKGAFWLSLPRQGPGGHGAYPHVSPNAIELAYELIETEGN